MVRLGFQPSCKLKPRPKLNNSTAASTSNVPEKVIVPPSQFYGVRALASPFGGYIQEDEDRHVRFRNPLVESTPLHIRQATANDNWISHSPPPPSLPLPPPSTQFKSRPKLRTIQPIPPTPPSPASDPIDFPSTPDHNARQPSSSEEPPFPKWPLSHQPPSPSSEDSQSLDPPTDDEQIDKLEDGDDDEVEFVEVGKDDEVEILEVGNRQERSEIVELDSIVRAAGKLVKGKEKAVEDQGEAMVKESAASVRSFLLRPTIEELINDLNLESGSGEAIRGVEVRRTAKESKADLLSRLLEAELYLAAGIDQLHDCLKTVVAGSSKDYL